MKPTDFPNLLKKGGTALLILLICCGISLSSNAGENRKSLTGMQIPYDYKDYDAIISGTASKLKNGSQITVKGSFTNNYWDGFCDIDVYLTTIKKDGTKGAVKRFYLGDLLEGETGKYELTVTPSEEIGSLELTFIYEICSTRHETPADFITIKIPWSAK
ncbi:MAG: hypothetical protein J7J70_01035 [Deltaproteobacteria bacterium]|nr:hypothetical protein [Candidatus Tharpellaceae bacterium]